MSEEIKQGQEVDDVVNPTDESKKTEEQSKDVGDTKIPYDRFKAKVDEANALKEKLAEFERAQAEKERKELEDKQEYKALYEKAVQDAEAAKKEALTIKKNALLTGAGYSQEQTQLVSRLVEGETEEEIAESITLLKATFPPQGEYADPSPMNSVKEKPKHVNPEDVGRSLYQRLRRQ